MKHSEEIKLDKLASIKVRSLGKCEKCGSKDNLQCCHIHSRIGRSTRWDLRNLLCLCASCHRLAHIHPTAFVNWLLRYKGKKFLKDLEKLNTKISKRSYQEVYKSLQ